MTKYFWLASHAVVISPKPSQDYSVILESATIVKLLKPSLRNGWHQWIQDHQSDTQQAPNFTNISQNETSDATYYGRVKGITVKACFVWDCASSLSQPEADKLGFLSNDRIRSCEGIKHAYHALALNEHRKDFLPLIWEASSNEDERLKQCWFLGHHSDVGGGRHVSELRISVLSGCWVKSQKIICSLFNCIV